MSYPVDLDEMSTSALIEELERRAERIAHGRCWYCSTRLDHIKHNCRFAKYGGLGEGERAQYYTALMRLRELNVKRMVRWHKNAHHTWTGADWSNAMQGEAGEAGKVVKKLRRIETGINQSFWTKCPYEFGRQPGKDDSGCSLDVPHRIAEGGSHIEHQIRRTHNSQDADREALLAKLDEEIADTYIYLDLLAAHYGRDITKAVLAKFNAVSDASGFPERL
jgi:hypothetical protein